MSDSSAHTLSQAAFADLDHEFASTRRMLERVPEERLAWRPDPKSMSLGGVALHVANLLAWQFGILQEQEYDLEAAPPPLGEPQTLGEILDRFDRNAAAVRSALDAAGDAALMQPWTLRRGDRVVITQPRATALRSMGISHMVHHRGQLSVYLRLLGVAVPGMYGPSADEKAR